MRLAVKARSWPHQEEATAFALKREGSLVAYDMGTGKTKIAVDVARNATTHGSDKVLVICPLAVASNWEREIEKWWAAPRPVEIINLTKGTTAKAAERLAETGAEIKASRKSERDPYKRPALWAIVNYERLASNNDLCKLLQHEKLTWSTLILDEVHRAKGATGLASKAIRKIKARKRVGLSGTPFPQGYQDVYGVLRAIGDDLDGMTWTAYKHRYAIPQPFLARGAVAWPKVAVPELDERIKRLAISCASEDVQHLPDYGHEWLWVTLPAKVKATYDEFMQELWAEHDGEVVEAENALVKTLRLQQIAGGVDVAKHEAKREMLALVEAGIGNDEPFVVFAQFSEELELARKVLEKRKRKCYMLTGKHKEHDDWRGCRGGEVLLCQMQAGSEGVDLTRSRRIIYLSTGYKSHNYRQSLKRIHRAGQERSCIYTHICARDTVDETIHQAVRNKIDFEDQLLDLVKGSATFVSEGASKCEG